MQHTFSLHKINDSERFNFSEVDYSRFKFGDSNVANKFGTELANDFIKKELIFNPISKQIVVIPSPYAFIPTATYEMKNYFVYALNKWLAGNGYHVIQESKVHRTITYKEDYGELDAEQRINLIGNDLFHIDKSFLKEKVLIFLDDIKITGSHEKMINRMIQEYGLSNDIYMLYYAELTNLSIHPSIENHLNYYAVKSIFDLNSIINSDYFRINTRIVKYILNYDSEAFKVFIENQSDKFIQLLYNMALGNNYHLIDSYISNLDHIKMNFLVNTKQTQYGN